MGHVASKQYICVWCKKEKRGRDFNKEHVLPRSFGTFENNITLDKKVCRECNGMFGRELEPSLARDSAEGFARFTTGLKHPSKFQSLGSRSTSRTQIMEGPYKGAWGTVDSGDELMTVKPFSQVGFAHSSEGPFEYFLVDESPSTMALKERGYSGDVHIRMCECSSAQMKQVEEKLVLSGASIAGGESFIQPQTKTYVENVFLIDSTHRRALMKIAFNYLVHRYGVEVALESRFDVTRAFVMDAVGPVYPYFHMDTSPILEGDKQKSVGSDGITSEAFVLAHMICLQEKNDCVIATLTLCNTIRYTILLAVTGATGLPSRGSLFDYRNRIIYEMGIRG